MLYEQDTTDVQAPIRDRAPAIIENPRHSAWRAGQLFQLEQRRDFQNAPRFQRVTIFAKLKK